METAPRRRDAIAPPARDRPGTQHHDALMPDPACHGGEVTGRNLDQDDPDAVRVLDPHLDQAPGLSSWPPQNRDSGSGRRQPGVLSVTMRSRPLGRTRTRLPRTSTPPLQHYVQ